MLFISLLPVILFGILSYQNILRAVNDEIIQADKRLLLFANGAVESIVQQVQNACRLLRDDKSFSDFHAIEKPVEWYESQRDYSDSETLQSVAFTESK